MKKLSSLTIALFLGTLTLLAQDTLKHKYFIPKGAFVCSGGLSFNFNKSDNVTPNTSHSFNVLVNTKHGYFVTNNLAMGLHATYDFGYYKQVIPNGNAPAHITKYFSHLVTPGIFLRYYKMFTPKFGLFGEFNAGCALGFNRTVSNDPFENMRDRSIGVNINVAPYLVYFVSNRLALEAGFGNVGYKYIRDVNSGNAAHSGGLSFNPNLNIGLSLYFGKAVQTK